MRPDFPFRRFPRDRPPWWPEEAPWPPHAPGGMRRWHRTRGAFLWRFAFGFVFLILFGGTACLGSLWLLGLLGPPSPNTPLLPWAILGAVLLLLLAVLRGLRGLAFPLRDLIEAAGRVETGDLSGRVEVRGPRELRALARAFNAMLERLRSNETARRRLLADVTHELRTPIAVIQGNLEAVLDGVYPADEAHLGPVLEETKVLSRLIDDLSTLSLAESGALDLHREATDLAILAGEVAAAFRSQASGAGVTLRSDVSAELPLAEVDPLRIREVLVNLTANALRHTPAGGSVRITGGLEPSGKSVVLSVVDNGEGIPMEELPHVFDRFYKSDDSTGSGLGLSIARNLVAAHGGEIHAESTPGEGTTVRFTLPLGVETR
jgi:two-component system, OmpR family, sensor histidine kinase BaeS